MTIETKACVVCGETKPITEFYLRSSSASGKPREPRGECKPCAYVSSRRAGKKRAGYPPSDGYHQPNCDICGVPCSSGRHLAHDHNHTSGEWRGWLCLHCNTGLGHFRDCHKLLREAIAYLARHGQAITENALGGNLEGAPA